MKNRLYLLLLLTFGICTTLSAQKFATDVPVTKQARENKIPGALYAPPKQTNALKSKGFEGSSLAKQMKDGKEDGLKYNFSTTEVPKKTAAITPEKTINVASDMSVTDAETHKQAKKTDIKTSEISNQEEKNN
jgi:hypothetical protein